MLKLTSAILLSIFMSVASATNPVYGNISVNISGLKNNTGVVRIALYNSEKAFEDKDDTGKYALQKAAIKITRNTASHVFKHIPYGVYAIKFYQDEDSSNRLERNIFGVPKVSYGFSNNAKALIGIPSFKQAKFNLDCDVIHMQLIAR